MAKELSEDSKFQISVKTLIAIVMAVATVIAAYFGFMATINSKFGELETKVERALELPKPGTLVPYADLTEDTVIGWVKARIGELNTAEQGPSVAQIEAAVENGVNEQKTPTTGVGKPW